VSAKEFHDRFWSKPGAAIGIRKGDKEFLQAPARVPQTRLDSGPVFRICNLTSSEHFGRTGTGYL
jgi:hypothetical protein